MEIVVLLLLAFAAAYFVVRMFVEGCTALDENLMMRKARRHEAQHNAQD